MQSRDGDGISLFLEGRIFFSGPIDLRFSWMDAFGMDAPDTAKCQPEMLHFGA
jgi:hypothetical protein